MNYSYDKDKIKSEITIEQMRELLSDLGGEPQVQNDTIISRTICHCGQSHKLYYWDNTHLFKCFTDCSETFDVFELVRKVKALEQEGEYELPQAIEYVAQYFGYAPNFNFQKEITLIDEDLKYLDNYNRIQNIELEVQKVELKTYDDSFLQHFPHPVITPWIEDGISQEVMEYYGICYDPLNCGIVIPHRNIEGALIGVRERTLIKENAEKYGKYLPMKLGKKMYNHPLSFNLYGLYQNQQHIKDFQKAVVLESEKGVMQYGTMFGQENNIAVAICGSSFINYQAWLLIQLGVKEIIVGLDRQYKELNDDEHKKLVRNLKNIHKKYGQFVTISYLFDTNELLGYKDSPTDKGPEVFMKLFKERKTIYN